MSFKRNIVMVVVIVGSLLTACGSPSPAAPTSVPAAPQQPAAPAAPTAAAPAADQNLTNTVSMPVVVMPAAEPTVLPQPTAMPTLMPANVGSASFNGVSFNFDTAFAQAANPRTAPAENPGADAPYWAVFPAYDVFEFAGYPSKNTYHKPRIEIYSVAEFEQMNQAAKDQIAKLKQLLGDAPATPTEIPLVPIFNAAQVFRAQVKYMNFQSGQGVRFITQYDQAVIPISNMEVFYTFQGLTSDGKWYIAAILPVATSALPDSDQVPADQAQNFSTAEAFTAYLTGVVDKLNGLQAADFSPNLDQLDAMIQSLKVER